MAGQVVMNQSNCYYGFPYYGLREYVHISVHETQFLCEPVFSLSRNRSENHSTSDDFSFLYFPSFMSVSVDLNYSSWRQRLKVKMKKTFL